MEEIICPDCREKVSTNAEKCVHCSEVFFLQKKLNGKHIRLSHYTK